MGEKLQGLINEYLEYVTSGRIKIDTRRSGVDKPIVYQALAGVQHIDDVILEPRFVGRICWGAMNQWDMRDKHYRLPDSHHQLTGPQFETHRSNINNPSLSHITPYEEAQFADLLASHGVSAGLVEPMISLTPSGKLFTVTSVLYRNRNITSIVAPSKSEYDLVIGVTHLYP